MLYEGRRAEIKDSVCLNKILREMFTFVCLDDHYIITNNNDKTREKIFYHMSLEIILKLKIFLWAEISNKEHYQNVDLHDHHYIFKFTLKGSCWRMLCTKIPCWHFLEYARMEITS